MGYVQPDSSADEQIVQLLAQADKQRLDLNNPMMGEDIHALIERLYKVPPDVIAKAAAATGEAGN